MRLWRPVLFVLYVVILTAIAAGNSTPATKSHCPEQCVCYTELDKNKPNNEGIRHLSCTKGGMTSIPIDDIEKTIRVIFITAPATNPNTITIGPIFTQSKSMENLEEVHIIQSQIPSIGFFSFWGLRRLRLINLSFNHIKHLYFENFRGLVHLKVLCLDNNIIESMPSEVFRHLMSLQVLTLSNNNITKLMPRVFRMMADLQHLDLSYNLLRSLNPEVFKDIRNLMIFKCRHCFLSGVNPQIYYILPNLQELDLGENLIKFLNSDEFVDLINLQILYLDGNQLSVIVDGMFASNPTLRILAIEGNRLALLAPGALNNLHSLEKLDISFNKISKFNLQTFLPVAHSLIYIDFGNNNLNLNDIAEVLSLLPNIQHVGLSNLSLNTIPENYFSQNNDLVSLDLSRNIFTSFPFKLLKNLYHLQSLNMSNNQMTRLDEKDLLRLEGIAEVDLEFNTWHCDCHVSSMIAYMTDSVLNDTIRELECHTPYYLQKNKFGQLTIEKLEPCRSPYQTHINIMTGLLVLLIILVISAIIYIYRRRQNTRYVIRMNQNKRETREEQDDSEHIVMNTISIATIGSPYHMGHSSTSQIPVSPSKEAARRLAFHNQALHSPPPTVKYSVKRSRILGGSIPLRLLYQSSPPPILPPHTPISELDAEIMRYDGHNADISEERV